jgi:hypothetical protein
MVHSFRENNYDHWAAESHIAQSAKRPQCAPVGDGSRAAAAMIEAHLPSELGWTASHGAADRSRIGSISGEREQHRPRPIALEPEQSDSERGIGSDWPLNVELEVDADET